MNTIRFLNESISPVNEGILFSTNKGREKSKEAIAKVDKLIGVYLDHCEASTEIVSSLYKDLFIGDIATNIKKKFNVLKSNVEKLKSYKDDMEKEHDEIVGNFKGNIFHDMREKRIFFNRADFNKKDVSNEYMNFIKKCSPDGEYYNRADKIYKIVVFNLDRLISSKDFDRIKAANITPKTEEFKYFTEFLGLFNWWTIEIKYVAGDIDWVSKLK